MVLIHHRRCRRGSLLVVALILSTLVLHAALEAAPLWDTMVTRSVKSERAYRCSRLNEAIGLYRHHFGQGPDRLANLTTDGPFVPRVYGDPVTGAVDWHVVHGDDGRVVAVE